MSSSSAVIEPVLDGRCTLGVISFLAGRGPLQLRRRNVSWGVTRTFSFDLPQSTRVAALPLHSIQWSVARQTTSNSLAPISSICARRGLWFWCVPSVGGFSSRASLPPRAGLGVGHHADLT